MVKKRLIFIIFIYLFFAVKINAAEEAPQIKAGVNPNETTIGVPVEYRVSIASKYKNIKILLPEEKIFYAPVKEVKAIRGAKKNEPAPNENLKHVPLYIIEAINKEDNSDSNLLYQTIIMKVAYYRAGKFDLPLIEFVDPDGVALGYKIPQITINALNKKGELENIEPPLNLSGNYTRLILLIAGCILAGGLLFLIIYLLRKRIKSVKERVIIPPPKTIFRKELAQFKKANYLAENDIESFVFELSMIFRRFLAASLHFDAVEMTNEEIYKEIYRYFLAAEGEDREVEMRRLMDLWDLSKFAEFAPSQEVLMENLKDTERFVLQKRWGEKDE